MSIQPDVQRLQEALESAQMENTHLQAELEASQRRYNNLFENSGDAIYLIDAKTLAVIEANSTASRRLGYTPEELIGLPLKNIESTSDDDDGLQTVWESSVTGSQVYECYYRHKDGHLIPVEVSSRLVRIGERAIIQNMVRNIEARKRLEAEREQLIADLDSFAHTVAHDLKNPLSNIVTYVAFLQEIWAELTPEAAEEHFAMLTMNSQKAVSIINELLLFASVRKIETVPREPLLMSAIVMDVERQLADMLSRQEVKITYPERWPLALGYAPWVREIWVNYISNAIKYGGNPPKIVLGGELKDDGVTARFWVRDNGSGIEADKLPYLFNKFSRLGDVRIEGHGLGLSIVKRIAEKLNGTVDVTSTPGQGSTFYFELPAVQHIDLTGDSG